jgi:hypothetical protein
MYRTAGIAAFILASAQAFAGTPVTTVKVLKDEYGKLKIVSKASRDMERAPEFTINEYPQFVVEHKPVMASRIIELTGSNSEAIASWISDHHVAPMDASFTEPQADEVRTIVNSGPAANRIDLVFMGDGYTAAEREKFFADITRLVNDMFIGKTFTSYLPVFNVHAVFRASNTSGIGKGSPTDTAYGLYREGETLRAIFPGKPAAVRDSCRKAPGCDYPVVIANDPYYGGLGGEIAISTSSATSGMIVLRHELGHNFGRVGEEYDGGGYFGANYSSNASSPSWKIWASHLDAVRAEPMKARLIDWPWQKLDRGPWSGKMTSDGTYSKTWIRVSASGIETPDTMSIKLDGHDLPFVSPNRLDRSFINIELDALTQGQHTLTFSENIQDHNNWLSSLTVHEYAADFHDAPDFIGAFPNFDKDLSLAGYRPTNESCLMRDMEHEYFCPICQENNWNQFFGNISLIDSAKAARSGNAINAEVKTLGLGQFRIGGRAAAAEKIEILWYADGKELTALRDQAKISFEPTVALSNLEVEVRFVTSEIRGKTIATRERVTL